MKLSVSCMGLSVTRGIQLFVVITCCWIPPASADEFSCLAQIGSNTVVTAISRRANGAWRVVSLYLNLLEKRSDGMRNSLPDSVFHELEGFADLESLALRGASSSLTAERVQKLCILRNFKRFECDPVVFAAIPSMPELEDMTVDSYEHQTIGNQGFLRLRDSPKLRRLSLVNGGLTDASLGLIEAITNLEVLNLDGNNRITDEGVAKLRGLKKLRDLNLRGVPCTSASLSALKYLSHLERLVVDWDFGLASTNGVSLIDLAVMQGLKEIEFYTFSDDKKNIPEVRLPKSLQEITITIEPRKSVNVPEWMQRVPHLNIEIETTEGLFADVPLGKTEVTNLTKLNALPNVYSLSLRGDCVMMDQYITAIAGIGIKSIRRLSVGGGVSDEATRQVAAFQHLESLALPRGIPMDLALSVLQGVPNMREFCVASFKEGNSKDVSFFKGIKTLRRLVVGGASYSEPFDRVLDYVKELDQLEELAIMNVMLTDDGLKRLVGLKQLRRLDLTWSYGYTDEGLGILMQELPNLETVVRSYLPQRKSEK